MRKSLSIPVSEPSQVGEARRAAQKVAVEMGFDESRAGTVGIIATELATNLHKYATGGELVIRGLGGTQEAGVEVLSVDRGPGMTEVSKCLEDGFSTAGTKGNGLGSIKRLSTVFDVYSTPQGSVILSQVWNKAVTSSGHELTIGAICLPYPGEVKIGDAWSAASLGGNHFIISADGLGHGKEAAEASDQAVVVFDEKPELSPQLSLQRIHNALRATRGAAVMVLGLDGQNRKITCSGIGNISGVLVKGATSKSFVSLNGTIGHQAQRFQEFVYDWLPGALLILHSDGLQTKWKLDAFPGLQMRHPGVVAAVLYRDFRRGRDDVSVLVIREATRTMSP